MQESQMITQKSASNLALAFILLPKAKRQAMSVLYAFCREVDDVADEETVPVETRRRQLAEWREDIRRAYTSELPRLAVNREVQAVLKKYPLKLEHFEDLLTGVEMDLEKTRYGTYQELEQYCYRVASVVGLLSIEIFGYQDPQCTTYAVQLGQALQLTNILRDVRDDALRGRIYLPQEALQRHQVLEKDILEGRFSEAYARLAAEVAQKARDYYVGAQRSLPRVDRGNMVAAELMGTVYWNLFRKLEKQRFNVFGPNRTRLSKAQKIFLILRTWLRSLSGLPAQEYGAP